MRGSNMKQLQTRITTNKYFNNLFRRPHILKITGIFELHRRDDDTYKIYHTCLKFDTVALTPWVEASQLNLVINVIYKALTLSHDMVGIRIKEVEHVTISS